MFGQIKQINTTLFSSNNNSIGSHSSLESDLLNFLISLHNTIRTYQSNPILTYDDGLSFGVMDIRNYYGMIEQTGSIFLEWDKIYFPLTTTKILFQIIIQTQMHYVLGNCKRGHGNSTGSVNIAILCYYRNGSHCLQMI